MMTNLGKSKEEIVYELLLSVNRGCNNIDSNPELDAKRRVQLVGREYSMLVEDGIIKEIPKVTKTVSRNL